MSGHRTHDGPVSYTVHTPSPVLSTGVSVNTGVYEAIGGQWGVG